MLMSDKTVWVLNPKGIKVALPEHLAKWRIENFPKWQECEPEYVPATKEYPVGFGMSEEGEKRRKRMEEQAALKGAPKAPVLEAAAVTEGSIEKPVDEGRVLSPVEYRVLSWHDLRKYAQRRGIADYFKMSKSEILKALDKSA